MKRAYRFLGWAYVAFCAALVVTTRRAPAVPVEEVVVPSATTPVQPRQARRAQPSEPQHITSGAEWFRRVKPYCNSVEVNVLQRQTPPPQTAEGAGYHAACFALAGRIDDARKIIDAMPAGPERNAAVAIVFDVGHPVADAGDDRSAGPIMELVVDYWPNHYMALYHAGMAEYMLGQRDLARKNLTDFLKYYHENDGWRSNGTEVLRRLNDSTNKNADVRRPREPGG
jgi:hypothetical protein